jgi:hypothetical protein
MTRAKKLEEAFNWVISRYLSQIKHEFKFKGGLNLDQYDL